MTASGDLSEFLLVRIAEDEEAARAASAGGRWSYPGSDSVAGWSLYDEHWLIASMETYEHEDYDYAERMPGKRNPKSYVDADANGAHIARHDPARVLAECAAKRQIITNINVVASEPFGVQWPAGYREALEHTLRFLALPYADHPDYDPAWRP